MTTTGYLPFHVKHMVTYHYEHTTNGRYPVVVICDRPYDKRKISGRKKLTNNDWFFYMFLKPVYTIKVFIPSYLSAVNSKTNKMAELDLDSEQMS
jgi:hypothetical protein